VQHVYHTDFPWLGAEAKRAKYVLQHVVRVHLGADGAAYGCVYQKPDDQGEWVKAVARMCVPEELTWGGVGEGGVGGWVGGGGDEGSASRWLV
jgi:hypothetical protein